MRRARARFVLPGLALAAVACVNAPRKAYTPAEAQALGRIDEVMRIHAEQMEPLFDLEAETRLDDAAFARMKTAATLIGEGTAIAMQRCV